LNEKLTYYLENPLGGAEQFIKKEGEKPKYTNEKYEKVKYSNKDRKVIKTEDFPSLS